MNIIRVLPIASQACRLGRMACLTAMVSLAILSPVAAQQHFKTPDEAAEALVAAARAGDRKTVQSILGSGSAELVSSGDAVQDDNTRKLFIAAYDARHSIEKTDKQATLTVGPDDYPFPIPMAQKDDGWIFDVAAGRNEILVRRIGRNEFAAIQVCLAYFDAQNEYADTMPKFDGMSVYAQRVVSSPGKKDGLYWPAAEGQPQSPVGEAVALATARGYRIGSHEPFHGYYYKILTRQGPKAPGGAHHYIVDGKMIGGFALVAWPAEYRNSGVMTFVINHDGDVYQKDLGEKTQEIASHIVSYNPDETWTKVVENEEKK